MYLIHYDILTDEQKAAWEAVLAEAALLPAETGDGTGWMFHGTDHLSSTYILHEGFSHCFYRDEDPARSFAYFGDLSTAVGFALKRMDADSPPAILAVKTSDLVAAGIEPDPNYADSHDEAPTDWRAYVAEGGTVRIRGGKPLPSLMRFDIGNLPLHPNATGCREDRANPGFRFYGRCMPHPEELPGLIDLAIADAEPALARP